MPYQKGEGKSVVIALGGNALGNTPQEQLQLVKDTAKNIVDMVEEGTNVIVSHGNGPQVGMINNAFAYASADDGKTPEMPFPEAGAMSQGYIGYQLSQAILNDMKLRGIDRSTACVVTQTVVDPADPAFLSFPYRGANPPSLAPSNRPRHPCRGRLRILRRAGGRREATRHLRYDGAVRPDGERGARASRLARR